MGCPEIVSHTPCPTLRVGGALGATLAIPQGRYAETRTGSATPSRQQSLEPGNRVAALSFAAHAQAPQQQYLGELGVKNRTEAVTRARKTGLIS